MNKMKYTSLLFLLFIIGVSHNCASAQSRKSDKVNAKSNEKRIEYGKSTKRDRYRIDVLIPLYLDETVIDGKLAIQGKMPEKVQSGLSFYQGIKLAIDTLNLMGYKTDILVHDINSKGALIEDLISKDSLKNSDLIIGFVSAQQVDEVAKYAAEKKVNFVSAFSPSDGNIKDNPYFILMNPTLENNCEAIIQAVDKKRGNEKILIFKRETISVDSLAFHFIVDKKELSNTIEVDCHKAPDSLQLSTLLDSNNRNIVVMPIMDALYAEKIIQSVHRFFPKTQIEFYGMPTWKSITSNKKMIDLGESISINITQPYYFDPTAPFAQIISEKYKSTFGGKPNDLTYRGFELVYWMTDLVNKYGAIFNEKTDDNALAIFTHYDLKPKWDEDNNFYYIENKHLYLYHYQAGTILVGQ